MLRIKAERLRHQLSQRQLAKLAEVPASNLSQIENGILMPYPAQRSRLAEVLGIDAESLLDRVELVAVPAGEEASP